MLMNPIAMEGNVLRELVVYFVFLLLFYKIRAKPSLFSDNSTGDIKRGCYPLEDGLSQDYKTCSSDDCNADIIIFM